MPTIQVVDFKSETAPQDFTRSLKETGFGVLSNHPIDNKLVEDVYALWYEYFRDEADPAFDFDRVKQDGHARVELSETAKGADVKDIKEFFHYYPWGRCPKKQLEKTRALYDALQTLAVTLLQWIEDNMPEAARKALKQPLTKMIENNTHTLFRILHYPPLTGDEPEGALRAASHEDINLITLLPAATAKGLQAKDAQGNWVDVPCNPGWIIINVGDMLQEATGHYYPSTPHRVQNPTGEAASQPRLSMPLFLHPRNDAPLSDKYPTSLGYLEERLRELGLLA